jgi:hypothetical protein
VLLQVASPDYIKLSITAFHTLFRLATKAESESGLHNSIGIQGLVSSGAWNVHRLRFNIIIKNKETSSSSHCSVLFLFAIRMQNTYYSKKTWKLEATLWTG